MVAVVAEEVYHSRFYALAWMVARAEVVAGAPRFAEVTAEVSHL